MGFQIHRRSKKRAETPVTDVSANPLHEDCTPVEPAPESRQTPKVPVWARPLEEGLWQSGPIPYRAVERGTDQRYGALAMEAGKSLAYAMAQHRDQVQTQGVGCYYGPASEFAKMTRSQQEAWVAAQLADGRTTVHPTELESKAWMFLHVGDGYRAVSKGAVTMQLKERTRRVRSLSAVLRMFQDAAWFRVQPEVFQSAPFLIGLSKDGRLFLTSFGVAYAIQPEAGPDDGHLFGHRFELPETAALIAPPQSL